MREVIIIPDTQSELHDNFQCFFKKLKFEIERHMMNGTNLVCGPGELETIDMFLEAFKKAEIDHDNVKDLTDRLCTALIAKADKEGCTE